MSSRSCLCALMLACAVVSARAEDATIDASPQTTVATVPGAPVTGMPGSAPSSVWSGVVGFVRTTLGLSPSPQQLAQSNVSVNNAARGVMIPGVAETVRPFQSADIHLRADSYHATGRQSARAASAHSLRDDLGPGDVTAAEAARRQKGGAGATLTQTAGTIGALQTQKAPDVSPDVIASQLGQQLNLTFDAQTDRRALANASASGVAGHAQSVLDIVAHKISIAHQEVSAADAPAEYQDAIKTANDARDHGLISAAKAGQLAEAVRTYASLRAPSALTELLAGAYQAAAMGHGDETKRLLGAFDQWEQLLGTPARPLIANAADLKADVWQLQQSVTTGAARSAPHVWLVRNADARHGVFRVVPLPSPATKVAAIPANFMVTIAPITAILDPGVILSAAGRLFAANPRPDVGARAIYRARRALKASVPAAIASATLFWLRDVLMALWRWVTAFFTRRVTYDLSRAADQAVLARDVRATTVVREQAAAVRRFLVAQPLTVGAARAAFDALGSAAVAYDALGAGRGDASAAIVGLRDAFDSAARGLRADEPLPPRLNALVVGPDSVASWASRFETSAAAIIDGRVQNARLHVGIVRVGAVDDAAANFAAVVGKTAGYAGVVSGSQLRAYGSSGRVRLVADVRDTSTGGAIALDVDGGDRALAHRLEDLGFAVSITPRGLLAGVGSDDPAMSARELAQLAAAALETMSSRAEAPVSRSLRLLAVALRRNLGGARDLAARLDGRAAFLRAPVIGRVGSYEALAPVSVDGQPVGALRNPITGQLIYAVRFSPAFALRAR